MMFTVTLDAHGWSSASFDTCIQHVPVIDYEKMPLISVIDGFNWCVVKLYNPIILRSLRRDIE